MASSLYTVLGVPKSASDAEISAAFKKIAKKSHPDLNPGDKAAEARFKKASAAYEILGDKDKRARYDRGEIDEEGKERGFAGFGGGGSGFEGFRTQSRGGTWSAGGGQAGGFGFEDILNDLFGGGGAKKRAQAGPDEFGHFGIQPDDTRLVLEIDLVEAARGCKKRVRLPDGSTVDLSIPSGVEDGRTLRLRGKGAAVGVQPPGDVLVEIKVRHDPVFTRKGLDLEMEQAVPLETAVLGGKVRTRTPDGEIMLTVPAGSTSGKRLRLKHKGVHDKASDSKGDLLVRLLIALPEHHDPDLDAAIRSWSEARQKVG